MPGVCLWWQSHRQYCMGPSDPVRLPRHGMLPAGNLGNRRAWVNIDLKHARPVVVTANGSHPSAEIQTPFMGHLPRKPGCPLLQLKPVKINHK